MKKLNILLVLIFSTFFLSACSQAEQTEVSEEIVDTLELNEEVSTSPTESEEVTSLSTESNQPIYTAYTESSLQNYEGRNKVIFFHANWCPTCRALSSDIDSKLTSLPDNTVILKADFDSETDLKQKYGVKIQHTLVFVDDEGNSVKPNLTGADFEELKSQL